MEKSYTEYYLGSDLGILWIDWPFQAYLFIIFIPSYPIDLFLHWVEEKRRRGKLYKVPFTPMFWVA